MAIITAAEAGSASIPIFLDVVGFSEGTSTIADTQNDGYDVIVTGVDGPEIFTDYSNHPFANGRPAKVIRTGPPQLLSTASGRYQLLYRYWPVYKQQLGLPDFSPLSQDKVAIQQMRERGALAHIETGDIAGAIELCSGIWASMPGNSYGQGGKSLDALLQKWEELQHATS